VRPRIADHLQAVAEGQIRRLLINVPPGHAKSLIVSVLWPAWMWIRNREGAQWRGLFASYAEALAMGDSVRCRDLMRSLVVSGNLPAHVAVPPGISKRRRRLTTINFR
jgi:hypothetical protein